MKLSFTKEEVILLIKKYYEEVKSEVVDVDIVTKEGMIGFYGSFGCYSTVNITSNENILGIEKKVTKKLDKNEVVVLLNEILSCVGLKVTSMQYDSGITVGSQIWDQGVTSAYFRGVDLEVEKIDIKMRKLEV